MVIKDYISIAKEIGRYVLLIPLLPILIVLMWIFSKAFEAGSKIPEDLDNKVLEIAEGRELDLVNSKKKMKQEKMIPQKMNQILI